MINEDILPTEVIQATQVIMLCKPYFFKFNDETAKDNYFSKEEVDLAKKEVHQKAVQEWTNFRDTLMANGITVLTYEDTEFPEKPDSVFCRDWNSFHESGTVILYPLKAENRRNEHRLEIITDMLQKQYGFVVNEIFFLVDEARNNKFLEGSGAIVYDNPNKKMYVVQSKRTHPDLIQKVKEKLGFEAYYFKCKDDKQRDVYHTDIMMSIGSEWAILCEKSIVCQKDRTIIKESLEESGHEVITISMEQMNQFAGNCYEVMNNVGDKFIIMSLTGYKSLTFAQVETLSKYAKILPMDITTIETIGGGSVRCMSSDIRLPKKSIGSTKNIEAFN